MEITRQEYDRLPFAIRQGALHLWGTPLSSYSRSGRTRQLYSFNDFFAEMCYEQQQLVGIYTFTSTTELEPYIETVSWEDMLA